MAIILTKYFHASSHTHGYTGKTHPNDKFGYDDRCTIPFIKMLIYEHIEY